MELTFNNFSVGDLIIFTKTFDENDFNKFSELSGDNNPLHHSKKYAATSGHDNTIVPLHLIIAPLSRIAGMNFPGVPSLYLNHTVRAVNQLKYGETITYSAKVTSLNVNKRILNLTVLGLRKADIIFDAEVQTHALHEKWEQDIDLRVIKNSEQKRVLITGSSGEIASSVANVFQKNGWSQLLQNRGLSKQSNKNAKENSSSNTEFLEADLNTNEGLQKIEKIIKKHSDIHAIIHLASPPVDSNLNDLVAVNYTALKIMLEAALPQMLANQNGVILSVGSTAMLTHLQGYEDYSAAKSMAASYLARIDKKYSNYNLKGRVLAPTFVSTEYSKKLRDNQLSLLPSEVATQVYDLVVSATNFMRVQKIGSIANGDFGFGISKTVFSEDRKTDITEPVKEIEGSVSSDDLETKLITVLRKILPKASAKEILEGGLDLTPGWDSLTQIQVILQIEKQIGVVFSSREFEALTTFDSLLAFCRKQKV